MKKFLLAFAAATMLAANVGAEEATFTCATDLGNSTISVTEWKPSADFTFTFDNPNGGTAPAYNKAGDIRLYAKNTATLTANNGITVQKVVFTLSAQGKKRLTSITADKGTIATQAVGDETVTWTGDAANVVYTVGEKAVYGSDGENSAGQFDFSSVTITYTKPATGKDPAGLQFDKESVDAYLGEAFVAPVLTKDTDAAVSYASSVETVATVDAEGNVTLVGLGTTVITASAPATDNFDAGTAQYTLNVLDPNMLYSNSCQSADCGFAASVPEGATNPWTIDKTYGLKGSGYINRKNTATEGVMASPVFDLTDRVNIKLNYENAINQFKSGNSMLSGEAMSIIKEDIYVVAAEVSGEEMPTSWTKVADVTLPASQSWTYYDAEPVDLSAYAGKKMRFGFRYASTTDRAGTWEIKNVKVTGEKKPDETKLPAELEFSKDAVSATLGEEFVAPVLTRATDAQILWTSSDEEVATVNAEGKVTLVAAGTTVITASAPETEKYQNGSASYTLTVIDPSIIYSNSCFTDECGFVMDYEGSSFNPWKIDGAYGLKASGYISNENKDGHGYAVSPVLDLSGRKNVELTFDHAVNQFKADGTLIPEADMSAILDFISVNIAEVTDDVLPAASSWIALPGEPITLPASQSWTYITNQPINLSSYIGKKVRIAFGYVSTTATAGTWEIKNVLVKGQVDPESAIAAVEAEAADAAPVYYNLQGVRVAQPSNGLYIVVRGKKVTKEVIR